MCDRHQFNIGHATHRGALSDRFNYLSIEILLKHARDRNSDRYVGDVVRYGAAARASIFAASNQTNAACERSLMLPTLPKMSLLSKNVFPAGRGGSD
jgi:hypothetical protein